MKSKLKINSSYNQKKRYLKIKTLFLFFGQKTIVSSQIFHGMIKEWPKSIFHCPC